MASLTIENYVKAIYKICQQQEGKEASTGAIASSLGVSPGTVTSMLKTLSDSDLVFYAPYEGVKLTESGMSLALRVLRRHRVIEVFLVKTLNMSWDEVHEEAENLEHSVSDLLIDRIDEFLGFPQRDPHGDPIPRSDGTIADSTFLNLDDLNVGDRFCVVRVMDQSVDFLRFLTAHGLEIGSRGKLVTISRDAGTICVEMNGDQVTLSREIAAKLRIERAVEMSTAEQGGQQSL